MTATTIRVQMAQRKDTAANWTAANPILLSGEIGYETDTKKFKIGNGSTNWNSLAYLPIPDGSGNLIITGNLEIGSTGSLTFEGSTADGFETTLAVTNPTADRTITLPNQSGTVLVSGNASIVDADIAANAEIAVSKLADGTARQLLQTDAAGTGVEWTSNIDVPGTLDVTSTATFDSIAQYPLGSAGAPTITFTGDNNTGIYSPGSDQLALATGGTGRLFVDASGNVIAGTASPVNVRRLHIVDSNQVVASIESTGTTAARISFKDANTTDNAQNSIGAIGQNLVFWSGNTERMRLDSSGRLGVGTSSPSYTLDVAGTNARLKNASGSVEFVLSRNSNSSGASISLNTGDTNKWFFGLRGLVDDKFYFYNNVAGNTALTIDESSRLGIGTTSPSSLLHVAGEVRIGSNASYYARIDHDAAVTGSNIYDHSDNGGHIFRNGGTERLRIDSSGRLLVGTSSAPSTGSWAQYSKLTVKGYVGGDGETGIINISRGEAATSIVSGEDIGVLSFSDTTGNEFAWIRCSADANAGSGDYPGRLVFSTTADGASSPAERIRIPSSGGLLINATSRINDGLTTIGFQGSIQKGLVLNDTDPANTRQFIGFHISGTTQIGYIANSNNTGVTYSTSSDYRLKENVTPVTDGITRLQQLKPSRFNFIAAPGCTVDGFIAHEVQSVVPEAITGEKDAVDADGKPQYQGIDQSKLVPLLTAALQEAVAKIESLEARLTAAGI